MTSKTANSVVRYLPDRTVGVLDRSQAGHTVQDVLGFGGALPVVGSMREGLALGPTAVLIGIAPPNPSTSCTVWPACERSSTPTVRSGR